MIKHLTVGLLLLVAGAVAAVAIDTPPASAWSWQSLPNGYSTIVDTGNPNCSGDEVTVNGTLIGCTADAGFQSALDAYINSTVCQVAPSADPSLCDPTTTAAATTAPATTTAPAATTATTTSATPTTTTTTPAPSAPTTTAATTAPSAPTVTVLPNGYDSGGGGLARYQAAIAATAAQTGNVYVFGSVPVG